MTRLVAVLLLFAGLSPAQSAGLVSGVVRNAWSRSPLRHALVTLSTTGSDPVEAVTYSDTNGTFAFSDVPPGTYNLCARGKGYDQSCFGSGIEPGRPVSPLVLHPHQNRQDLVLNALPLGSVSGTVLDGEGDPVANAQVQMLHANYYRRTLHWITVGQAPTNDRGEYHMGFVRPGQYRFLANRRFQPAVRIRSDVTNGEIPQDDVYVNSYYPGTPDISAAASVTLNAGNEIKGIDFVLNAVPAAKLSGHVEVPPEAGQHGTVSLQLIPATAGPMTETAPTGAGGPEYRFQFPFITSGPHRLIGLLRTENHNYLASQTINVPEGASDISVPVTPGSPLKGRLDLLGKDAKQHGPYKVRLIPGDDMLMIGEAPTAEVHEDGTFEFSDVVPGLWDIGVEPIPPGSYIKSMMLGKKDVLTDDMFLGPGDRESLDLVLDMDGAIVKGAVVESGTEHPERAEVLLAPDGKFDNVLSFYEAVATDEEGHFTFKSVTPGRYKIYAFDRMESEEWANPEFLKPYHSLGEAFEVGAGARLERKVPLIVRGESGSQ